MQRADLGKERCGEGARKVAMEFESIGTIVIAPWQERGPERAGVAIRVTFRPVLWKEFRAGPGSELGPAPGSGLCFPQEPRYFPAQLCGATPREPLRPAAPGRCVGRASESQPDS